MNEVPDELSEILFIKYFQKGVQKYGGYKRDYLVQNLSEMEEDFLLCKVCSGIMRDAAILNGETTCLVCSQNPQIFNKVNTVQNRVGKLDIICPFLRECIWKGKLSEVGNHLENCCYSLIECLLCKQTIPRIQIDNHMQYCLNRQVKCEYCSRMQIANELGVHHNICQKYIISCPNGCTQRFPRKELIKHRVICELEEIKCPYFEYGCLASPRPRMHIQAHKKEYVVEHTDLCFEKLTQQNTELSALKKEQECLLKEHNELKRKVRTMKQLTEIEWEIKDIKKLKDGQKLKGPEFYWFNFKLKCHGLYSFDGQINPSLFFFIERIEGEFDKTLGESSISQYRVMIVHSQDYNKSYYEDGPMNYHLRIGNRSEMFYKCPRWNYTSYVTPEKSLFFRFCFDAM